MDRRVLIKDVYLTILDDFESFEEEAQDAMLEVLISIKKLEADLDRMNDFELIEFVRLYIENKDMITSDISILHLIHYCAKRGVPTMELEQLFLNVLRAYKEEV